MQLLKKLFGLFSQSWFIALCLTILASLIIWFVVPQFSFHNQALLNQPIQRWLAIFVVLILWGIFNLFLAIKRQKKHGNEQQEESAAKKHGAEQPDLIETVRQEIAEHWQALAELKQQHAKHYLVLGAKASGKTTALQQAQINVLPVSSLVPINSQQAFCSWYNSDQGIFIEADAEQLLTYPTAWQEYLNFWATHERLASIVICVSSETLLNPQADLSGKQMIPYYWHWLEQLYLNQGKRLSVFLLLTKADKVRGFNEVFQTFNSQQTQQALGFKLVDVKIKPIAEQIQQWLAKFAVDGILPKLNSPAAVQKALAFPQQLAGLKNPLITLLNELLQPNKPQESPLLYGVYLSSASQEGPCIAPFYTGLNESLQVTPIAYVENQAEQRPYFLNQLFTKLLPIAGKQAKLFKAVYWRKCVIRGSLYLLLGITSSAIAYTWFNSYLLNRQDLHKARIFIENYQQQPQYSQYLVQALPRLKKLLEISLFLDHNKQILAKHWGLYTQEDLTHTLKEHFLNKLNHYYGPIVETALQDQLTQSNETQLRQTLQVYLMLAKQLPFQQVVIQQWFTNYLATSVPEFRSLWPDFEHLFALYLANQPLVPSVDSNLVTNAQQRLQPNSWQEQSQQNWQLLTQAEQQQWLPTIELGLNFQDIFNSPTLPGIVPILYLQNTLSHRIPNVLMQIMQQIEQENALLSPANQLSATQFLPIQQGLIFSYLQQYVTAWKQFLYGLKPVSFTNLAQAQQVVNNLALPNSPIDQLLILLKLNTNPDPQQLEQQAAAIITPAFVDLTNLLDPKSPDGQRYAAFKQNLMALSDYLNEILLATEPPKVAFASAKQQIAAGDASLYNKLLLQANALPKPVSTWFSTLIYQAWQMHLQVAATYVNAQWQQLVYVPYQEKLAAYYPLAATAPQDVNIENFTQFFRSGGTLAQFIQNYMLPFVTTNQDSIQPISYYGATLPLSKSSLQQLQAARNVQTMFFGPDGQNLRVQFTLMPLLLSDNASLFRLHILGAQLRYEHGPQVLTSLAWPNDNLNVYMQFIDLQGQSHVSNWQGTWAWLHVLSQQAVIENNMPSYAAKVSFKTESFQTSYLAKFSSGLNPLSLSRDGLALPANLLA